MGASLRIARVDVSGYRLPGDGFGGLDALHRELQSLIRRHLPGVTASVLALPVPVPDGKTVDWYSDLPGQPQQLTSLPAARRAAAKARLADRLDSLRRLADAMPGRVRGTESLAAALRAATHYPDDSHVYVIGDEPVVTLWGFVLVRGAGGGPALVSPAALAADAADGRRRWPLVLAAGLIALLGFLGGGWFWFAQRQASSLEAELAAATAANCVGPDRLGAFALGLDRLDPQGRGYPELRRRLALEQGRCAAATALERELVGAAWDCARLGAVQERLTLADPDPGREPFLGIAGRLAARLGVCRLAAETGVELDRRRGDCAAIAELDRTFGRPPADQEPLRPVREGLDRELGLCAAAERLTARLDAALQAEGGDCPGLVRLDRESAGPEAGRPPLARVRERLSAELARCQRAQSLRQALVDAQLDCAGLRKLDRDLVSEDMTRDPLRGLRRQLDEALQRCTALEQLEQAVSKGVKSP